MTGRRLLTDEERRALLGVPDDADGLARLFTLTRSDRELVAGRRSDASRLGFAVQLALLRHPGTTLVHLDRSPEPLVAWLAGQLDIPAAAFADYARRPQTVTTATDIAPSRMPSNGPGEPNRAPRGKGRAIP